MKAYKELFDTTNISGMLTIVNYWELLFPNKLFQSLEA